MTDKEPYIILKWGTLKGWGYLNSEQANALQKWHDLGCSAIAMMPFTDAGHNQALCDAIDLFEDGQITNDWTGEKMTREQAKKYIMEYQNHRQRIG